MSAFNMEEVLQYSNKFVTVNEGEMRSTKPRLAQILDTVTDAMKHINPLFKELFEGYLYGGSTYDGLKVGKPDEFDIDLKLHLPKDLHVEILQSDKDGFVYLHLKDWDRCTKNKDQFSRYEDLIKYKDGDNYLSQEKIKTWMFSIVKQARNKIEKDGTLSGITEVTQKESGPAVTLVDYEISIDLVAVFRIPGEKWPEHPVRSNFYKEKDFLVVPKPPKAFFLSEHPARYWRLSFPVQERELMNGLYFCKPALRFLKKLRDTHKNIDIPSYFIKTVFLWEIERRDRTFWNSSLTNVFLEMLKVYKNCIKNRNIPYYWSEQNNFLESNTDINVENIQRYLEKMIAKIEINKDNPLFVAQKYLLTKEEYEEVRIYFENKYNVIVGNNDDSSDSDSDDDTRNTDLTYARNSNDTAAAVALGVGGIALLGYSLYKLFSPSTSQRNN